MTLRWVFAALAFAMMGGMLPARAAITERLPSCSWDRPGHNPFMGDLVAALDRYTDIPADVRQRLQQRMARRQYDDMVSIRRDSIEGRYHYEPRIHDMHFGERRVCGEVSRAGWTDQMQERGLVYCDSGHCILVPTVCRNVSRIARRDEPVGGTRAEADEPAVGLETPLVFGPPGAGHKVAGADPSFEEGVYSTPASVPAGGVSDDPPVAVSGGSLQDPLFGGGAPVLGGGGGGGPLSGLPARHSEVPTPPSVFDTAQTPPAQITPVPEPSTWALFGAGFLALTLVQRRTAGRPSCSTQNRL